MKQIRRPQGTLYYTLAKKTILSNRISLKAKALLEHLGKKYGFVIGNGEKQKKQQVIKGEWTPKPKMYWERDVMQPIAPFDPKAGKFTSKPIDGDKLCIPSYGQIRFQARTGQYATRRGETMRVSNILQSCLPKAKSETHLYNMLAK